MVGWLSTLSASPWRPGFSVIDNPVHQYMYIDVQYLHFPQVRLYACPGLCSYTAPLMTRLDRQPANLQQISITLPWKFVAVKSAE